MNYLFILLSYYNKITIKNYQIIKSQVNMKQTKSISLIKDYKKSVSNLNNNHRTDLQQLDMMCSALSFANGFHATKLVNSLKFQIKETLPYLQKNKAINGKSAKKSKFEKIGTLKPNQNKKQTAQKIFNNQNELLQVEQNSRNKEISIQYYHSDLKQRENQRSKLSPQKQKKSNSQFSNLQSINSLYHVFKDVQLKISEPVETSQEYNNKSDKNQISNASQFLKTISTKSKVNQKYQKHQSPIDMLKPQKNKYSTYQPKSFNQEPNFLDISEVQLISKKIQKPNKNSSQKQQQKQRSQNKAHSKTSQQSSKPKSKFQKVQKKSTNKIKNSQSKSPSQKHKNQKKASHTHKQPSSINVHGHKRNSTDDSLQNLHIELQYIHKVKENQQKQKLMQKQKQKNNNKTLHEKEKDSFSKVLQQEQMNQQYQTQEYKILRSTSELSEKQIYELMSVQGNKYKQIALKNYFKKQKSHNHNHNQHQY